jgi:hypothetical protein
MKALTGIRETKCSISARALRRLKSFTEPLMLVSEADATSFIVAELNAVSKDLTAFRMSEETTVDCYQPSWKRLSVTLKPT